VSSAYCDTASSTCQPDQANGAPCTATSQCKSGFCTDGVCCDSPCNGICSACAAALNTAGTDGICGAAKQGMDPHDNCSGAGISIGRHDGNCEGNGACENYASGAVCGPVTCTGNVQTGAACDGLGSCAPDAMVDCGSFLCEAGACHTSCTDGAECIASAFCD